MQTREFQTARAHEEPYAVQFSVFMPNRVGQFRELLDVFASKDIRVVGVSVVDSTDWAVVRLIVTDPNHAREVLRENHHSYTESDVVIVEMASGDTLREVCEHLLRAEINVHFAYPLTLRAHDNPLMAFHVDDLILATQLLIRRGMTLLGHEDLADPT